MAFTLGWVITMTSKPHATRLVTATLLLLCTAGAKSEVTLDGSMGGFSGTPVQPGNGFTYDITADLGRQSGSNLFHSFDKFNIDLGQQANFSGPAGINNIVSRVTGGQSAIAGKITSNISGASLYLVNPAGFVLTNGAVVDVSGSFYLSTVDFLEFADGARFFSNLSATSTLSTSAITDFGFLQGSRGTIAIDSSRATPGEDKSTSNNLNVNAQFISLRDADLQAQEIGIRMGDAAFGNINLENSTLESVGGGIFFEGGNIVAKDSLVTASGRDSKIQIRANSLLVEGVSRSSAIRSGEIGASGGDVDIVASDITLSNATLSTSSGGGRAGGDISLGATRISLNNGSQIALLAGPDTRAGDININTTDLRIQNNSNLNSSSKFQGSTAGSINIQATGRFGIESGSKLLAESENAGVGGEVNVIANTIVVTDRATIDVQARGTGSSDTVDLRALESITITDNSNINASSASEGNGGTVQLRAPVVLLDDVDIIGEANGRGTGGNIAFDAGSVSILNGSTVSVSSKSALLDAGDAGTVDIKADSVTIDQTKFLLSTQGGGVGGTLNITAPDINVSSTLIAAEAQGAGSGGDIIMRGDSIDWLDVEINASIIGQGKGGEIQLQGGVITLTNPNVNISAKGPGAAGDFIATGDKLVLQGTAGIFGDTEGNGVGADIQLLTSETYITDIVMTSSSQGDGKAGEILINSPGGVTIINAKLDSRTSGAGLGGDIDIQTQSFAMSGTGSLNVAASGSGNAGHIDINTNSFAMSERSALVLTASGSGIGGQLTLNANTLLLSGAAQITGSVERESVGDLMQFNAVNMTVQDQAKISSNTTGSGAGGTIDINTTNFLIRDQAGITAETLSPGNGDAGLVKIKADQFQMIGGNIITNSKSAGEGGIVDVAARTIDISGTGAIKSDALNAGDGGDIQLKASESFQLGNASIDAITRDRGTGGQILIESPKINLNADGLINISALSGTGNAGKLNITGDSISLDASSIGTATLTAGDAGTVTLAAADINISNSDIQGETRGQGTGADILLMADNITVIDSPINSSTLDQGPGGVITLKASQVLLDGASIITETKGSGTGGSIIIEATQLDIVNQGNLNGRASDGSGDAGDIRITAETLNIEQGLINLVTSTSGTGGTLSIDSNSLHLDQAELSASATGGGDAGAVNISTLFGLLENKTNISSDTTGDGTGGDILISANTLDILSGTVITSSATGPSDAGDVTLLVPDQLQIVSATVQTTSARSGGGSIEIQTQNRIRIDNGLISASANGVTTDSGGGNVSIDPELFTLRQSQIVAQANAGTGGNISLVANNFVTDSESLISASSQRGIDGTVSIESPNQAVNPISVDLNTGFQNLPDFISNNCTSPALRDRSYLIVENMHPVRQNPADYLPIDRLGPTLGTTTTSGFAKLSATPGC